MKGKAEMLKAEKLKPEIAGGSARAAKTDLRVVRCAERLAMDEKLMAEALRAVIEAGITFLTRKGLAVLLKASVRTVDEMVANDELRVMRPGGVLVRFYLPHVVEDLEKAAARRLKGDTDSTNGHGCNPLSPRSTRKT